MTRPLMILSGLLCAALLAASCKPKPGCPRVTNEDLEGTLSGMIGDGIAELDDKQPHVVCARKDVGKVLDSGTELDGSLIRAMIAIVYSAGWTELEPKLWMLLQAPGTEAGVAAISGLAEHAPDKLKTRLGELLDSESSDVRKAAAETIVTQDAREQIAKLIELFLAKGEQHETYRQALTDMRAGKEIAAYIAANPDEADREIFALMSEASDGQRPLLGLMTHESPTIRAAAMEWAGNESELGVGGFEGREEGNFPGATERLQITGRGGNEPPAVGAAPDESDVVVLSALARATRDLDARVRAAAQARLRKVSDRKILQPAVVAVIDSEAAKADPDIAVGLCLGLSRTAEHKERFSAMAKSKDEDLKKCAEAALEKIAEIEKVDP